MRHGLEGAAGVCDGAFVKLCVLPGNGFERVEGGRG